MLAIALILLDVGYWIFRSQEVRELCKLTSKISDLPQRKPTPVGPYILWPESQRTCETRIENNQNSNCDIKWLIHNTSHESRGHLGINETQHPSLKCRGARIKIFRHVPMFLSHQLDDANWCKLENLNEDLSRLVAHDKRPNSALCRRHWKPPGSQRQAQPHPGSSAD